MAFLHEHCISGPIQSRRLGTSLGVNLLPCTHKICNYNCVYCECGWNQPDTENIRHLPSTEQIAEALESRLLTLSAEGQPLHSITFSGNGEPTLHPQFEAIMEIVCRLRD
ncbi:MAG: radical SAM protein, partial [Bacteroidales bacterium]|nr:radical SAM protein [Bacteroidales bacterium]